MERTSSKPGKRTAKPPSTEEQLLGYYRRLAPRRQKELFDQIVREAHEQDPDSIIRFSDALSDPIVLREARRLAAHCHVPLKDFGEIINPFSYNSYFARSDYCTLAKLTNVDASRIAEIAEVTVEVKARRAMHLEHRVAPEPFNIHVLFGSVEIERDGLSRLYKQPRVVTVNPGGPVILRAHRGAWFIYATHPLTAWIRRRQESH